MNNIALKYNPLSSKKTEKKASMNQKVTDAFKLKQA